MLPSRSPLSHRALCAAVVTAVALGPWIAAAAADAPASIGTFAIGETASAVRAEHGDPLRFVRATSDTVSARYPVVGGAVFVSERNGAVVGVTLTAGPSPVMLGAPLADDHGVRLGMTREAVLAAHADAPASNTATGLVWRAGADVVLYRFGSDGALATIDVVDPRTMTKPDPSLAGIVVPPGEHDGSSVDTAIVIAMTSDISGRWERFYYALNPCDGKALWKESSTAIMQAKGRSFDRNAVTCPTTGAKRDIYFDVTAGMDATRKLFQTPH